MAFFHGKSDNMVVSENSVALNPMVFMIIIPFLNGYFIGNIPYFQTNPDGENMGNLWGEKWETCGETHETYGKMIGTYGENMGKIWGTYGDNMGKIWGKYGEDIGGKYGTLMGKICETYGETMENMGGQYGGHMGKIGETHGENMEHIFGTMIFDLLYRDVVIVG